MKRIRKERAKLREERRYDALPVERGSGAAGSEAHPPVTEHVMDLSVPETRSRSCRTLVLMDQATENVSPDHRSGRSVACCEGDLGAGGSISSERWGRWPL